MVDSNDYGRWCGNLDTYTDSILYDSWRNCVGITRKKGQKSTGRKTRRPLLTETVFIDFHNDHQS